MEKELPLSDQERDYLIESYQPLITPIAIKLLTAYRLNAETYLKILEQAGLTGIWKAVTARGNQVTKQYINRAIRNSILDEIDGILRGRGFEYISDPNTKKKKWNRRVLFVSLESLANRENLSEEGLEPGLAQPDERLDARLDIHKMQRARKQLEPCEQEILRLRYDEELTVREVEAATGMDKSKVWRIEAAALKKLKFLLTGETKTI
jgi:RNA polymerase sigma factor (sigma-70 family)